MEKKKNTGLIILVVILSLLVVGLGGYIAYDKVLSKNDEKESGNTGTDKKEEIKDDNEKELNKNDEIVKKLYSYVKFEKANNSSAINVQPNIYFYANLKTNIDDIPDDIKMVIAYNQFNNNDFIINDENNKTFKKENLDGKIRDIFGNTITYNLKLNSNNVFFTGTCEFDYIYDLTNKTFTSINTGCGGPIIKYPISTFNKAIQKDNNSIEIYEKIAYVSLEKSFNKTMGDDINDCPSDGLYKDKDYKVLLKEDSDISKNIQDSSIESYTNELLDKMSIVKYTFKKDSNNNYHFYSSEIID